MRDCREGVKCVSKAEDSATVGRLCGSVVVMRGQRPCSILTHSVSRGNRPADMVYGCSSRKPKVDSQGM